MAVKNLMVATLCFLQIALAVDLASLPDNTALDLGRFPCTQVDSGTPCERVTDYSGMAYDSNTNQMLLFGGGHATTFTDTVFAFDFESLAWRELYPPTPCSEMKPDVYDAELAAWTSGPAGPYPRPISRHTYDSLSFVPHLNELVMTYSPNGESYSCTGSWHFITSGKISHFSPQTGTWRWTEANPGGDGGIPSDAFDPVSRKIVMFGRYGLWTYDPDTGIKTKHIDGSVGEHWQRWGKELGYADELVYYPPNDRFYYFNRVQKEVWEISLDRTNLVSSNITRLQVAGNYPPHSEPGFDYDSVNHIIGGAVTDSHFYAFDPTTMSWSRHHIDGSNPGTQNFHMLRYSPRDNVFIFIAGPYHDTRTWAYRYKSGTALSGLAASLTQGEWAELETNNFTYEDIHKSQDWAYGSVFSYANKAAWDPVARKLYFIGKDWNTQPYRFISYDDDSNTWSRLADPYWFSPGVDEGHGYDGNAVDPVTGDFYHHKTYTDDVYRYSSGSWQKLQDIGIEVWQHAPSLEYFPEMDGLMRAFQGNLHVWLASTGEWTQLASGLDFEIETVSSYSPVNKKVLFGGGNYGDNRAFYLLNPDRTYERVADSPYDLGLHDSLLAADPANSDWLAVFGNGEFWKFNPDEGTGGKWTRISLSTPWQGNGGSFVVAPINTYGIIMFAEGEALQPGKVYIYKHSQQSASVISHPADTDASGCIESDEMLAYVRLWKTTSLGMAQLMDAISIWKEGC